MNADQLAIYQRSPGEEEGGMTQDVCGKEVKSFSILDVAEFKELANMEWRERDLSK